MSDLTSFYDEVKLNQRLKSYNDWSSPVSYIGLAAAGFSFTGQLDRVYCHECKTKVVQWTVADDPLEVHIRLAPICPFLKSIGYTPGTHIPRHVQFTNYIDRLESMKLVPEKYHQSLPSFESIASAGFSYQGTLDRMRCYDCGLILKDWEPSTDAFRFHQRFRPECYFVKSMIVIKNGGVIPIGEGEPLPECLRLTEISITAQIGKLILEKSEKKTTKDELSKTLSSKSLPDCVSNSEQMVRQLNQDDAKIYLPETTSRDTLSKSNKINTAVITSRNNSTLTRPGSNMRVPTNCGQQYTKLQNNNRDLQIDSIDDQADGLVDDVDGVVDVDVADGVYGLAEKQRNSKTSTNTAKTDFGDKIDELDGKFPLESCSLVEKQNDNNNIEELDVKNPSSNSCQEKQDGNKLKESVVEDGNPKNSDLCQGILFDQTQRKSQKKHQPRRRNHRRNTRNNKITEHSKTLSRNRNSNTEYNNGKDDRSGERTNFHECKQVKILDAQNILEGLRGEVKSANRSFVRSPLTAERDPEEDEASEDDFRDSEKSTRRTEHGKHRLDCVNNNGKDLTEVTDVSEIDITGNNITDVSGDTEVTDVSEQDIPENGKANNENTFSRQEETRSNERFGFPELIKPGFTRDNFNNNGFISCDNAAFTNPLNLKEKSNASLPANRGRDLTLEATQDLKDNAINRSLRYSSECTESSNTASTNMGFHHSDTEIESSDITNLATNSSQHSETEKKSNDLTNSETNSSNLSLSTPLFHNSRAPYLTHQSLPPNFSESDISELPMVKAVLYLDIPLDKIVDTLSRRFETYGNTYPDAPSLLGDILNNSE